MPPTRRTRSRLNSLGRCRRPLIAGLALAFAACGEQTPSPTDPTCATDPSLCPAGPDTTAAYIRNLPSWDDFAQPDTTFANVLLAEADTMPVQETIVDSLPVFGDSGVVNTLYDVRYVCQDRPYSISDAPERIVMFSPNQSILYPGAFIQGRSRKELGSLLPLRVAERRPIEVVIGDLPTGANSREVEPTSAAVAGARGDMIGSAVLNGLGTPSTSTFELETYHSERSFALSANLSGRYLGYEASISGSTSRSLAETTVTAHYYEKMYTVTVEPPVEGFFSDAFTNQALEGYVADGVIGPDNLPVYVSEVVYGRMMMFSVTSTASESDIRAAMQASYNSFAGSASGGLNTRQQSILENSRIAITAVGGSGEAAAAMIRSGDWSAYFESSASLDQAVPLSYTFTNIGDGSIAAVTEATEYNISECQPKPLIPGTFDYNPLQSLGTGMTPGYDTRFGDVNGDGRGDMVFTYLSGSTGEVGVALGQMDGSFSMQTVDAITATPPEGWSTYDDVVVADVDGDGNDDVVANSLTASGNAFYVGLSNGDGSFTWGARDERGGGGWGGYTLHAADTDNMNGADLLWHEITSSTNRTYVSLANGDGTFDHSLGVMAQAGTCCWAGTDFLLGDVTGDGYVDLIHSRTLQGDNANWISVGNGDGTFDMSATRGFTNYSSIGWADYDPFVGDIDGDQNADLIWIADARPDIPVHRALGTGPDGKLVKLGWHHIPAEADSAGPYEIRIGDVDADGDADLVMVDLDSSNNNPVSTNRARIWVGLGTDDQLGVRFDFTPVDQLHPDQAVWGQFEVHMMDVDGDNKDDLILHWASSPHQIYVGLAK